jgi:beta-lactamase regulating signal transducer with metallopeptidase domain
MTTDNIFATLALQQFASLDGVLQTYTPVQTFPTRTADAWIIDMGIEFPVFTSEFIYDPDMTVLLLSPDPGPENSLGVPSSASPSQQQIRNLDAGFQPWIAAPIVVAVVIVGIAVAATVMIRKRMKYRKQKNQLKSAFVHESSSSRPDSTQRPTVVETKQPKPLQASQGWQKASKPV